MLEAQNRVGGRVLTVREPWADDLYVEAGAARIPDNHDVTMKYVREFNLPLTPFLSRGRAPVFDRRQAYPHAQRRRVRPA